ncbi:MAG: alpha/beta fold hydrolase [Betaproteobacteria bacterium]|nr:alpha/beta fold hydrolase [Betaproteobacteria bacterium]
MSLRDVVLLHGWGSGAGIWDDLARRLEPRFRPHALPLPGYGPDTARALSLEAIVTAVARAAPRRCGVVGWSLGGEIALAWARRAPRQVERLALIATTPCFTSKPGWPCATAPAVLREFGRALATDRTGTLARFTAVQAKGDARARRFAGVLQRFNESGPPADVLAAGLAILSNTDLRRELSRVGQPALVLHGARDRIVPPAAGRRLAAALPNARFELLRTCAHAPFLSQPARVAAALREFFDE